MANKVVPSFTQVPVVANDVMAVYHSRTTSGATIDVTIEYLIRDDANVIRGRNTARTTTATYPLSGANALAACNTAEGT